MVATPTSTVEPKSTITISWEALPEDFVLEEEPVENTAQPLIAGALRESLELSGYIQPNMLIASNLGICATIEQERLRAAQEHQRAAQEHQRAERLIEQLRSLGINPTE
jgi:hypothetical protein